MVVNMKKKHLVNKLMAFLTNLVILLLPILVWDFLILFVLAGILPASVMSFLDNTVTYILIASLLFTTPFIAMTYGQTFGHTAFDLKVVDLAVKPARPIQIAMREFLGLGVVNVGLYLLIGWKGPLIFILVNMVVVLIDPLGRSLADFVCHTRTVLLSQDQVDVAKASVSKPKLKLNLDKFKKTKVQETPIVEPIVPLVEKKKPTTKGVFHYDLRTHSKYSLEGDTTVEDLIVAAKNQGVDVLSITDKHTVKANFEATVVAECVGIQYIPGIELDCLYNGKIINLLGYNMNFKDSRFTQLENDMIKKEREDSHQRVILFEQVTNLKLDEAALSAKNTNGIITGEIIAEEVLTNPLYEEAPILKPYRSLGERSDQPAINFYWDYFAEGKPCYVNNVYLPIEEGIALIKDTGGYAILGSPKKVLKRDKETIKNILQMGVRGLEVFSPYHSEDDILAYLEVVREECCFVSSGSDYYGASRPALSVGVSKASNKFEKLLSVFVFRCLHD